MFNTKKLTTMANGITLADLIMNEAQKNESHYNLRQYAKTKEQKLLHHNICKELVNLSVKHGIPFGVLVYIAVGTSAHKPSVFESGYKAIHTDKAEKIINLCRIFGEHFGERYTFNDKVVHACAKYYEVHQGRVDDWCTICKRVEKDKINMPKIKRAQDLLKLLCGDLAEYSKVGRVISINL